MEYLKLSNGLLIPQLGFGSAYTKSDDIVNAILVGYRHIDCAQSYGNEEEVGKALKYCFDNGIVKREELFITTKLNAHKETSYDIAKTALEESLRKLNIDYVDQYLIHAANMFPDDRWKELNKNIYRALEELYDAGIVKSIGVSNFMEHHLEELLKSARIKPMINQIELSPFWQQKSLVRFCKENDILLSAWSPLGCGKYLSKSDIIKVAQKYNKSGAQLIIRHGLQKGYVVLPKTVNKDRMIQNLDVFDFIIDKNDMEFLDSLNSNPLHNFTPDSFYYVYWQSDLLNIRPVKIKYKLFNKITLLKVLQVSEDKKKYYLFGFIKIWSEKIVKNGKTSIPFIYKSIREGCFTPKNLPPMN